VKGIAGWSVLQVKCVAGSREPQGGGYYRVDVVSCMVECIAGWRVLQSEVYCVVENIAECPFDV
jgi:hypothetical protein